MSTLTSLSNRTNTIIVSNDEDRTFCLDIFNLLSLGDHPGT
jgi:hypothetical protein